MQLFPQAEYYPPRAQQSDLDVEKSVEFPFKCILS